MYLSKLYLAYSDNYTERCQVYLGLNLYLIF